MNAWRRLVARWSMPRGWEPHRPTPGDRDDAARVRRAEYAATRAADPTLRPIRPGEARKFSVGAPEGIPIPPVPRHPRRALVLTREAQNALETRDIALMRYRIALMRLDACGQAMAEAEAVVARTFTSAAVCWPLTEVGA